jgi:O-acetyl-ADP-ribose deacetylase (regulator of RNase III)
MYGDITELAADALVSSDDNYLTMGGGVSSALSRAGGDIIRQEARKHLPLKIGDVVVTSAGQLKAKYIFHAVTIDYDNMIYANEQSVQSATLRCMQLADTLGVRLIGLPAIGTGVAHFPFQLAAEVITRTIADYLQGNTKIEFVTIVLFARELVTESALNVFYERAVSLASLSTQSRRLVSLMSELNTIVGQMNIPTLSKQMSQLQAELEKAQNILAARGGSVENMQELQDRSGLAEISEDVVVLSAEAHERIVWEDRQLEANVLRTKLGGLLTQLNIQISNLNKYEIEKAKYGGIGVPPRLDNAIDEAGKEITETEKKVRNVRLQLVTLGGSSI